MAPSRPLLLGAAFGAGALVGRGSASAQLRFARMTGSSIAGPDAAGWITDFLNAAYYRREPDRRDVDELRLASAIVTTRWHRLGHRRLRVGDAVRSIRRSGATDSSKAHDHRVGRSTASSYWRARAACWAPGFRTPTATTSVAVGASPSRPERSARPMTRRCGYGWRGLASPPRLRRLGASRRGTHIR